jgi:cytoskeletal protein CcmA (bactofilin family)
VSVSYDQTIGGTLFGDATLIGKDISIIGESFGDMRIVGDVVYISGVVNKDLIIAARHVIISPEAIINGDTLILAHTVELSGKFLGASQITASKISVNGSIEGVTTLTGSKIIFNTSAKILSDVSYFSPQKASVSSGVDIQKQLNFNQIESIKQNDVIKRLFFAFVSFWAIIKLIATLFVIFILTHLFRVPVQRIVDNVKEKKAFLLITGAGSFLLIPLLIVILFGSLVLIPVSVIVGAMFVIMIMLLPAMSAIISASLYQLYIQKQSKININFTFSAWALVVLTFIGFIPYVGGFVLYLLYIVSFGAMTQYFYDIVRRKKINF